MEAFKAVPRRGLEVGGVLLGHTEVRDGITTLCIAGFEVVESEHRSGPNYQLSETDLERLDETIRRHGDAIGIYRTQTRSDKLALQPDDVGLFHCFFKTPDRVFLLVQPMSGAAALFLPEGDAMALAHEFPFRWSIGTAADSPPQAVEAPAITAAPEPPTRGKITGPLPPPAAVTNRESVAPLVVAAAILTLSGATLLYTGLWPGAHAVGPAAHAGVPTLPPPLAGHAAPTPQHIALRAVREGRALRLEWDRSLAALREAGHGILYITDGAHQSHLDLDPLQLTSGVVSYWPETQDVTFRLEVFSPGGVTSDSLRVVGGLAPTPAPSPAVKTARPAAAVTRREASASRMEVADTRPSPFALPAPPPPPPAVSAPTPVPAAAAAAAPRETAPLPVTKAAPLRKTADVSVVAEPVAESRMGRVVGKIPLIRRLHKKRPAFVPPTPIKQVRPVLNARAGRELTRPVPVDVKVYVAESGQVRYAELLSDSTRAHRELATAAVYAARRWEFEPARLGDDKAPGEVILHFRFAPVE
jgi:TonB family protein